MPAFTLSARLPATVLLLAAVAACGNGATDVGPLVDYPDQRSEELRVLGDRAERAGLADPAALPPSGTATYTGVVAFDAPPGVIDADPTTDDMVGDLTLTVAFGAIDTITGSADGFRSVRGDAYRGELEVMSASLDRGADTSVEFTYAFDLLGRLRRGDDPEVLVDLALDGQFFDADAHGPAYVAGGGALDGAEPRSRFCTDAAVASSCGAIPRAAFAAERTASSAP